MQSRQIIRNFFNTANVWSSVNKSDLAKLRKKTGYTFANCKKALEINKDIVSAEKWLKEQAQALGWSKAEKLQGRTTLQGLIGVSLKGNTAVMVEVNCETDFVGRNKKFKSLVETATDSCMNQISKNNSSGLQKFLVSGDELKTFVGPNGKSLADHCALAISDLGENLNLRRALCIQAPGDVQIAAYAHPNSDDQTSRVVTGKYGALVAYKSDSSGKQTQQFAKQLCQHVVGMNPRRVGVKGEDEPATNQDDEEAMIFQEFLLDPEISVGQFISNVNIQIVDFARIECGESLEENTADPVKLRASG